MLRIVFLFTSSLCLTIRVQAQTPYHEPFRPQVHFSPKEKWMNDPNGMVFFNGEYHLFFQYNPDSLGPGAMHWGHAVSKDLSHWEQLPVALDPDSLGYIFSGSAVVDSNNTSGFGKDGKIPLVAIFTQHDPKREKAGRNDFQNQSLAYSLDNGRTWTKYAANPVLRSPGLRDFRDPKLIWYEENKKWIMTLAAGDHIIFYSSADLKNWKKESEFGAALGSHGGIWECPDLEPFMVEGKKVWLLIVNMNPGGPQGGSATQYFTGFFDGTTFIPSDPTTKWADYGADDYAGVTWSNTGSRKIFMGWMNNWLYAQQTPTTPWRGAMTTPRELGLKLVNGKYMLTMFPVYEFHKIDNDNRMFVSVHAEALTKYVIQAGASGTYRLDISSDNLVSFSLTLSNNRKEELVIGYDDALKYYYIDRTKAGKSDFSINFPAKHIARRLTSKKSFQLTVIMVHSSVELFADDGLTCITDLIFPKQPMLNLAMKSDDDFTASTFRITDFKSIWK